MASQVSVTRKTFLRNVRRGKWVTTHTDLLTPTRFCVVVPKATKGVYNGAGRTMYVDIHETKAETEARLKLEQDEALARIRALQAKT